MMIANATPGRPLRVCLVSGAPSAGRCGIHDYVGQLASALRQAGGIDAEIVGNEDWSVSGTWRLARRIRESAPDVVHLQYPMIVGWHSLGPHLLGLLHSAPQVVTLHEFINLDRLRRAALGAFAVSARHLVFTTEFDRDRFARLFPMLPFKSDVIRIASNIPLLPHRQEHETIIVHFGQLKPGRGIEEFLKVAELAARDGRSWKFRVVGAPVSWASGYVAEMRDKAHGGNVDWRLDVSDMEAAETLRGSAVAYLPYPDGASERRGSLIAALGNGVPVVTTRGPFVTAALEKVVRLAPDPGQAYGAVADLISSSQDRESLRAAGLEYVSGFSWSRIAEAYRMIYSDLATNRSLHA